MTTTTITNDPSRAGQRASKKDIFGEASRFALYAVHTRGDAVAWFVEDAETRDEETGLLAIVVQQDTAEKALAEIGRIYGAHHLDGRGIMTADELEGCYDEPKRTYPNGREIRPLN